MVYSRTELQPHQQAFTVDKNKKSNERDFITGDRIANISA